VRKVGEKSSRVLIVKRGRGPSSENDNQLQLIGAMMTLTFRFHRSLTFASRYIYLQTQFKFGAGRFDGIDEFGRNGVKPPLMTKELYRERAVSIEAAMARCAAFPERAPRTRADPDEQAALTGLELAKLSSRNVSGMSQLNRLPYFDMVLDSLTDAMHIVSGWLSRNIMARTDGSRFTRFLHGVSDKRIDHPGAAPPPRSNRVHGQKRTAQMLKGDALIDKYEADLRAYRHREDQLILLPYAQRFGKAKSDTDIAAADAAYRKIQAPPNIAPASKRPFGLSGQMTAHHWVNFAKVYGKFLMFVVYDTNDSNQSNSAFFQPEERPNRALDAVCKELDILAAILDSNATAESKVRMNALIRQFAKDFNDHLPETEKTINMHNLLFHIPHTIERWGPARGYWCFPFERSVHPCATYRRVPRTPNVAPVSQILTHALALRVPLYFSQYDWLPLEYHQEPTAP
jgi:hypothetical protein